LAARKRTRTVLGLAAVGSAAGFASTLFGIGGGLVLVPLLAIVFGVPLKRAVGTSLLCIVLVSAVGVAVEAWHRPDNLRPIAAALLAAGAIAGSGVGARLAHRAPELLFRRVFALFLVLAAVRLLVSAGSPAAGSLTTLEPLSATAATLALGAGLLAGVTSALFGVGGGIVAVPLLGLLFADVPFHSARATSLLMIVPTSLAGAWHHHRLGNVDPALARVLVPPAFGAAAAGVLVANRAGAATLEGVFAALLVVAALRLARPEPRSPHD